MVDSLEEDQKFKEEIANCIQLCEKCIEDLMSEESNKKISNIEVLIDKMLTF